MLMMLHVFGTFLVYFIAAFILCVWMALVIISEEPCCVAGRMSVRLSTYMPSVM